MRFKNMVEELVIFEDCLICNVKKFHEARILFKI